MEIKIKAFTVRDKDTHSGTIVFHFTAPQAKYKAMQEVDLFWDLEFTEIEVHRCKDADKYITDSPSVFHFAKHSKEYRELGWYEEDGQICHWCGLGEYEDLPESTLRDNGEDEFLCPDCLEQFEEEKKAACQTHSHQQSFCDGSSSEQPCKSQQEVATSQN